MARVVVGGGGDPDIEGDVNPRVPDLLGDVDPVTNPQAILSGLDWIEAAGQALIDPEPAMLRLEAAVALALGAESGENSVPLEAIELAGQALVADAPVPFNFVERAEAAVALEVFDGPNSSLEALETAGQALVSLQQVAENRLQRVSASAALVVGEDANVLVAAEWLETAGQALIFLTDIETESSLVPIVDDSPFFLQNWASQVRISTTYNTQTRRSPRTDKVERVSLAARPRRTVEILWTFDSVRDAEAAMFAARKFTDTEQMIPLYPDTVELQVVGAGGSEETAILWSNDGVLFSDVEVLMSTTNVETNVVFDTTNRRFEANGAVLFFALDPCNEILETQRYNIIAVTPEGLVLNSESPPVFDFEGKRWFAVPELLCEIQIEPQMENLTSRVTGVSLLALEKFGPTALAPSALPNAQELSSWDIAPDADRSVATSYRRAARLQEVGRADVVEAPGDRYELVQTWPMTLDRAEWYQLLRLFDGNRGRWLPFLVPEHSESATFGFSSGSSIFLEPLADVDFPAFAQRFIDAQRVALIGRKDFKGQVFYFTVVDVKNLGVAWELQTVEQVPMYGFADIEAVCPARLVYFESDTLDELWIAPDACTVDFSTVEDVKPGSVSF